MLLKRAFFNTHVVLQQTLKIQNVLDETIALLFKTMRRTLLGQEELVAATLPSICISLSSFASIAKLL